MDKVTAKRLRLRGSQSVLIAGVLLALVAVLPGALASSPGVGSGPVESSPVMGLEASPSPSVAPSPLPTVSCVLSQTTVVYGAVVTVSGVVSPAGEGQEVAIALAGTDVATATTDTDGRFTADISPSGGGEVVARLVADGVSSPAQWLVVKPKVTITYGTPIPFLSLRYVISVAPASYTGTITTTVSHNGVLIATLTKRVGDGEAVFDLPLRGVGLFAVKSSFPAVADLSSRTIGKAVYARSVRLSVGSSGPHVRGLLTALSRLHIRVPYVGNTLSKNCGDAVMAFQKAYRLPRTYVVDGDDWRKLDVASTVRPRYSSPYDHLEVDKGRQILMVVRNGAVRGLIAVSTGATGNTPEGRFRIQQKHSFTTSWYGGAILYRTMGFYGNFAIHGYVSVPPYPASHGCIREPMWVADWVYDRSSIGERLYIYH